MYEAGSQRSPAKQNGFPRPVTVQSKQVAHMAQRLRGCMDENRTKRRAFASRRAIEGPGCRFAHPGYRSLRAIGLFPLQTRGRHLDVSFERAHAVGDPVAAAVIDDEADDVRGSLL